MRRLLRPNAPDGPAVSLVVGWICLFLLIWTAAGVSYLPTPTEVLRAVPVLWGYGFGEQLWNSFALNLEAVCAMAVIVYLLAIATVMPLFRPLAVLVGSGRFNGFVGMPIVFMAIFQNAHLVKVALLVFGAGVFTLVSLVKMIQDIPKELFDHSRTLRMGEWRVVWEVVVLGRMDEVIDILRINVAMLWVMLPMVEGRFRYEGGVGALMEEQAKHFNMDAVFAALAMVLAVGILQDLALAKLKGLACPYSALGMERT